MSSANITRVQGFELQRPWRDCAWIGLAWTLAWMAILTTAHCASMGLSFFSHGAAASTIGYIVGFATSIAKSYALSGIVGGIVLGVGAAFVEDDARASRVGYPLIGAVAGGVSTVVALSTHPHFPRLWIPGLTVPFYVLAGSVLAAAITATLLTRRRVERDRLLNAMQASQKHRLHEEAARLLEQRSRDTQAPP